MREPDGPFGEGMRETARGAVGAAMTPLRNERAYRAALAEFDDLCLAEAGTADAARFAEVVDLIDAYTLEAQGRSRHPLGWLARWPSAAGVTAGSR